MIPFILVPVIVVVVFSMAVIAIAVRSETGTALVWLGLPSIVSVFSSSGVPPVRMLPSWMRPQIHLQPMLPTIESMRALAQGGPALWPLLLAVIVGFWSGRGARATGRPRLSCSRRIRALTLSYALSPEAPCCVATVVLFRDIQRATSWRYRFGEPLRTELGTEHGSCSGCAPGCLRCRVSAVVGAPRRHR